MQTDVLVICPYSEPSLTFKYSNMVNMIPLTGKIPSQVLGGSLTGSAVCYVMQQNKHMLFEGLINLYL